ncbi:MAG: lysophospholipid acyltransferase family protein [Planctomycetota bacterium]
MSDVPQQSSAPTPITPASTLGKRIFYGFFRRLAQLVLRVGFGARSFHRERVPATGALLIASNHQSFLDPPLVGSFINNRQLAFVARVGLFRSRLFGWFIGSLNALPIREDGGSDTAAIKAVLTLLAANQAVVIFPEGSRTPDGATHEFKRGVSVLVKRAKCTVVPAAIEGVFDAWPVKAKRPRPFTSPVMVMYGHPIAYEDLMKDGADAAMVRLAREVEKMRLELRAMIRARTGGRYPAPGPGDKSAPWIDAGQGQR